MPNEQAQKTEEKVVWALTEKSHILTLIGTINDKCVKAGKGAHSVEYWCEDLLLRGANAFSNYLDADKERRNREAYVKEMSRIQIPNPNDPNLQEAMNAYAVSVAKIQRKFGIGGTQVEVK